MRALVRNTTALFLAGCVLFSAAPGEARVEVPERAVFSIGDGDCNMYVDGCKWGTGAPTNAEAESGYLKTITDGVAAGVDAFFLKIPDNSAKSLQRMTWFNTAMRQWNAANPTRQRCIAPMFSSASGNLNAIFDAANTGGSASPLCEMDGKAMVGAFGRGSCTNPFAQITGRGSFVALGAVTDVPSTMADKACIDAWRAGGAERVLSMLWTADNINLTNYSTIDSLSNTTVADGAEFVMGAATAKSVNCGTDDCAGSQSDTYLYTDMNAWAATLRAFRAPFRKPSIQKVALNMSFPGNIAESSYFDGALVCDPNDSVDHSVLP